MGNFTPLVIQWLEQVLRENNRSLVEIFMSPSLVLLVAYTFLAILLHNVCFILHLSVHGMINDVVKKRVLAKSQRSSLRIHLCASEQALEFLIVLQLNKINFFTINVKF